MTPNSSAPEGFRGRGRGRGNYYRPQNSHPDFVKMQAQLNEAQEALRKLANEQTKVREAANRDSDSSKLAAIQLQEQLNKAQEEIMMHARTVLGVYVPH